jgi:hypothetical protein
MLRPPSRRSCRGGGGRCACQCDAARSADRRIDAKLDDAIWRDAQWLTELCSASRRKVSLASQPMRVAFAYDERAIYIGARMDSNDPKAIRARSRGAIEKRRQTSCSFRWDTYRDGRTASSRLP